jgi:hypothetical protein
MVAAGSGGVEISSFAAGVGLGAGGEASPPHPARPAKAKAKIIVKRILEGHQRNLSLFGGNSDSGFFIPWGLSANPLLYMDF